MRPVVPTLFAAAAALLAACAEAAPAEPQAAGPDPLLAPIAEEHARQWLGPREPVRIHGNSWLVGFEGLEVGLIDTGDGLILIDGAVPQAVPALIDNLARAGFRLQDVKYILSTEPHYDHSGGIAALARDSGATVVASPEAAEVLARGRSGRDDPQFALLPPFPAVSRLKPMADGETLTLGSVTVTARATPGHTPGSMSWSWRSCEGDDCRDVVFASSLNPISADGYLYSAPGSRALHDGFRRTFARVRELPCDILISSHPAAADVDDRLARYRRNPEPNPFIDPGACRAYADRYERLFDRRLARERGEAQGG